MAKAQPRDGAGHTGGIASLSAFVDEHPQAVQADLIKVGLRLRDVGSPHFTWGDLSALVWSFMQDRESNTARDYYTADDLAWDAHAHLLAAIFDAVQIVSWTFRDVMSGGKGGDPPEPMPRPGIKPRHIEWKGEPRTIEEMDRLLGWNQN